MGTLADVIQYAFAPDGPVHRVLGQHRPAQNDFAASLATYAENPDQAILLKEAFAGSGKTDPVLIILGLDCLLTGRKSLIATFTRTLRSNYLSELATVNRIIELTLTEMKLDGDYRPLTMGEFKSKLSLVSPSKMDYVRLQIETGDIKQTPALLTFLRTYDSFTEAGIYPEFSDIYTQCELPPDTTELHWAFCAADYRTEVGQMIALQQSDVRKVDILLVTHAMLIRNSITKGSILDTTATDENDDTLRSGLLVVDEAEKLPLMAAQSSTATISHNDIMALLAMVAETYEDASADVQDIITTSRLVITESMAPISQWLDPIVFRTLVFDQSKDESKAILNALRDVQHSLYQLLLVASGKFRPADHDEFMVDEISRMRQEITIFARGESLEHTKMSVKSLRDEHGEPDVQVVINFSAGRHLINQLWRGEHSISGIAMISATIADMPPNHRNYTRFLRAIGYDADIDRVIQSPPLALKRFGRINEVIVASRTAPHPTNSDDVDAINAAFVTYTATALTTFAERQQDYERMIVLFPSYRLLNRVYEAVPSLQGQISRMSRRSNQNATIAAYAKTPRGIYFGVEWEGINIIDPVTKRTLADLMVIPRLPQPPSDDIRISRLTDTFGGSMVAQQDAEIVALREGTNAAYRRMVQGLARGIRNASDVIKALMILDIRFPVPPHVVETRMIAQSGGDATKIFARFHTCLEPYRVRHWSQIDQDGVITKIL